MIALIPARENSKRFPGKNRSSFRGKPLLELAYDSAVSSGVIDEIFISTDDTVLIEASIGLGIKAPFVREPKLASDSTTTWEVVEDFIERTGYSGDICLLQLTSPRRNHLDIQNLHSIYKMGGYLQALTVVETLEQNLDVNNWYCRCSNLIQTTIHCEESVKVVPNGAAYMLHSTSVFLDPFSALQGSGAVLMDQSRSLDIDFESQLQIAEREDLGGKSN